MNKKMKNQEIIISINNLVAFVQKDKVVPIKLSYAISKNQKALVAAQEPYEESRQKIARDLENNKITEEAFNKKLAQLLDMEVDVDIYTIPEEIIEEVELTTKDYMSLEFMFEA